MESCSAISSNKDLVICYVKVTIASIGEHTLAFFFSFWWFKFVRASMLFSWHYLVEMRPHQLCVS